jgi:hypothetical protein
MFLWALGCDNIRANDVETLQITLYQYSLDFRLTLLLPTGAAGDRLSDLAQGTWESFEGANNAHYNIIVRR